MELSVVERSAAFQTVDALRTEWATCLAGQFPVAYVEEYATSLSAQCVSVLGAQALTDAQMAEMKIRVGHRRELLSAASNAAAVVSAQAAVASSLQHRKPSVEPLGVGGGGGFEFHSEQQLQQAQTLPWAASADNVEITDLTASNEHGTTSVAADDNSPVRTRNRRRSTFRQTSLHELPNTKELQHDLEVTQWDIKWHNCQGECSSFDLFFSKISDIRAAAGFPSSFDRAFLDNNPMPLQIIQGASVLLLLRVPDLTDGDGTTVSSITNRFVLMFSVKRKVLLTYHRCRHDFLARVHQEWMVARHAPPSVADMVDQVLRRVGVTYSHGAEMLQATMEDCEEMSDRTAMIWQLTGVHKKAQVYLRCMKASVKELEELKSVQGFAEVVEAQLDQFEALSSTLDELSANALSTMDMQMALNGFRDSVNLKVFTYIAILCQPITVATGWYGMNWTNFPELLNPNGYFIFAAVVLGASLSLLLYFVVRDLCSRARL